MYVWHRANHRLALLWRFHRMHHSDPEMDVTTATRFHLGEHIGATVLRLALIPLLGLTVVELVLYESMVVAITMFHHANISLGRWDDWLRLVVVTPNMHKVHHSRYQLETDSNYSTFFSWWDRLGRSFQMRKDCRTIELGLDGYDEGQWQNLWGMLKTPFVGRPSAASTPVEDDPGRAGEQG
jgi:sterol desaturase/sphingolipid hydroxylase (fatty acid hydroxylase superfamily)